MISKHGSPLIVELGQYYIYIYNKYPLNADIWSYCRLAMVTKFALKHMKRHRDGKTAGNDVAMPSSGPGAGLPSQESQPTRRELEDSEDLLERDLYDEELFGREYDLLDERETIDDEDLFERDLEDDELFGREYYDLMDEQYYWWMAIENVDY